MIKPTQATRFEFHPVCDKCWTELLTGPLKVTGCWEGPVEAAVAARAAGWSLDGRGSVLCGKCKTRRDDE